MADRVTTGRFVGRTNELAWLDQLLARAGDGEPLVVLLGGEAGVGKTRLVEQLAATARERGVRVLGGGCVPLGEEGLPFAPVTEALRGLADYLDTDELAAVAGPARQELARLVPDLPWGGEAAAGPAVASRAGQGRLFELLLGVVQRLAATTPLLWVVEDLHWADRSTRDLLAYLATYLRAQPVLLVLTFRNDELHRLHPLRRLLGELVRNRRVVRLQLPRFTRAEVTQQVAGLLGTDPPARLVDDIYTRSEGNPFLPRSWCWPAPTRGCCHPACSRCCWPGWCGWATVPSSCCGSLPRPALAPPSRCWPRSPAWRRRRCWRAAGGGRPAAAGSRARRRGLRLPPRAAGRGGLLGAAGWRTGPAARRAGWCAGGRP
jgi:AAA ATPase domain